MNIYAYIKPYRFIFALVFFMGIISTFITAIQPLIGKFLIDDVLIAKNHSFAKVLGLAILVMVFGYSITLFTRFLYFRMSLNLMLDMRSSFYQHLIHLPVLFFAKNRTGDIVSRINEDLTEIQRLYTENVLQLFTMSLTFLFNIILLWVLDWKLTLISLLFIPILIVGIHKFRHLLFEQHMELRKQSAKNQSMMVETFSAIRFIRTAHVEATVEKKFYDELKEINKQNIKVMFINAFAQGVPQTVLMISTICMIWFLGSQVLNGTMSIGTMIAFMAYQASLFGTIQGFAQLYLRLQKGRVSIQRVHDFFQRQPEKDGSESVPETFSSIQFKNVSFLFELHHPILQQVNFTIRRGEKIGLIGDNGIGKSTIANLLARVYEPNEGSILFDSKNIRNFTRESWYQRVCLIAHDHPIWYGTFFDFLQLGKKNASSEEMLDVIRMVGLDRFIATKPTGLKTQIGENGVTLSAGQKQRLLLARALLQDADILILDEATSHLDVRSESEFFQLMKEHFQDKTIIIITHRYQNLEWLDRLIDLSEKSSTIVQKNVGGINNVSLLHG
ncbi:ABC-type bacteriocin/lantibiotic exporter with double-glycine peptidase domain [Oikeobacillus pervagus]|uniref:ABC-type bacteriocin/lantibiotic exporter with double-glycine peptidase domain n=1 Tax=Oikeobacillus pervagus TaxID=1325931 RepID=A0AAJ1SZT3_9BACI|nr:ABC transporter ATP-binding protein [Oikeobacillus pervagus]MDQ0215890.1 ABC-type bacteriocin/lantibiotic exporter with double-glycine peptidase domain [Oikeobacillus pervagus]